MKAAGATSPRPTPPPGSPSWKRRTPPCASRPTPPRPRPPRPRPAGGLRLRRRRGRRADPGQSLRAEVEGSTRTTRTPATRGRQEGDQGAGGRSQGCYRLPPRQRLTGAPSLAHPTRYFGGGAGWVGVGVNGLKSTATRACAHSSRATLRPKAACGGRGGHSRAAVRSPFTPTAQQRVLRPTFAHRPPCRRTGGRWRVSRGSGVRQWPRRPTRSTPSASWIADPSGTDPLLTDQQIETLLDLAGGSVHLAAAQALEAIAVSEVLVTSARKTSPPTGRPSRRSCGRSPTGCAPQPRPRPTSPTPSTASTSSTP